MEMPVSFDRLTPTIKQAFAEYVSDNVTASLYLLGGYYADYSRCKRLVTVLSVEQDYLFDEAMTETTLAFQVIGYDDVFYWTHKEKEECPF